MTPAMPGKPQLPLGTPWMIRCPPGMKMTMSMMMNMTMRWMSSIRFNSVQSADPKPPHNSPVQANYVAVFPALIVVRHCVSLLSHDFYASDKTNIEQF